MEHMMKVVLVDRPGEIQILERPIPRPNKGEALLKVKYCGICGSDVAVYRGNQPFATYPRVPGHEFSAEIISIQDNELGLKEGMLVTANPYFNCGACYPCKRGRVNCCIDNETMGVQRDGSFAQYIIMPIHRIFPSKGLNAKTLALVEPFGIGFHAVNRADIKEGEKVLVLGAGAIGIFAMLSALLKGAQVYIADLLQSRLEIARELGASDILNLTEINLDEKINEITKGNGMDTVVEAVGLPQSFLNAVNVVSFSGKVVLIGNGTKEVSFNQSILVKKELNIYGSRNSLSAEFKHLINLVNEKRLNIDRIVTDVYPLEKSAQAFFDLTNSPENHLKVLLNFDN
ncbi:MULTISPECIES: zinc-binding alcohol dehydrogenase family protein [Acetomicrobium]|jgi:2-desacetyl-2-hydroxyethyl bacteriochlorophyllide A dehydrogenase|uniref:zinc-binding alcohol dehydrogenase family protein n=1 Tax=Acetomicrobium TaxID=49894 RepID=UPI0026EE9700|nr:MULTISPECIES: zinc-binding alcohol dehydrogenase family protein [Acetomicrobium]MDR9769337.1 zinc-binding alcohol dehydrogenase family protein [Acetomicrobium sp.]